MLMHVKRVCIVTVELFKKKFKVYRKQRRLSFNAGFYSFYLEGQQKLVYLTNNRKFCTRDKFGDLPAVDEAITFSVMQKA